MNQRQEVTQQEYERIKALLGADAEMFKLTKLGQYILDRADMEIEGYTKLLKDHDAHDAKGIQHLQNEIYKNAAFKLWLDDAIHSGHMAMQNLTTLEGHDDESNFDTPPEDDGEFNSPPELPGE